MKRFSLALWLAGALAPVTYADTTILMEDFESYADNDALFQVWKPKNGAGTVEWVSADPAYLQGELVDETFDADAFPTPGQGVAHLGGFDSATNTQVLEWTGLTDGAEVGPSATQNLVVEGDIFDSNASGNKRMSIGLRSKAPTANILELGLWNANTCDPTVAGCNPGGTITPTTPGFIPSTGYAARTQVFGPVSPPLLVSPNWQFYQLPAELDRTTDADELVNIADIGEGWHHYKATIGTTEVKLEIDLFRDGVRNDTRDEDGVVVGMGTPGVDATIVYPMETNAANFDSLRIGGPSGLTSAGGLVIFDNIKLSLVDIVAPPVFNADFNGNLVIDAADVVVWRNNFPTASGATRSTGDSDSDGDVDQTDYVNWKATFSLAAPPGSGSVLTNAAVPEPSSLILILAAAAAFLGRWR